MSSAIKFDRCGNYSDVCRNGKIAFKSNVESIKWEKYMDLCEDCFGKVKQWLTNEVEK